MIALRDVSARVGDFALAGVSFDVPQGAYGIVIGPTGAGKTTLVEAVAGLVPITGGTLQLGGTDCTKSRPETSPSPNRSSISTVTLLLTLP